MRNALSVSPIELRKGALPLHDALLVAAEIAHANDPTKNLVDVLVVDSNGSSTRFAEHQKGSSWASTPRWSSNGQRLIFSSFQEDYIIKALRGASVETVRVPRAMWLLDWSLTISTLSI